LPAGKINELLRQFESSWSFENSSIARIDCSAVGANQPIEDAHFQTILKNGSVCIGVLDGHWTSDCSRLSAYALPLYIEKYLQETNIKGCLKDAFKGFDADLMRLPWKALSELSERSIHEIEALDPKRKLQALVQSIPAFSGSCAIVAKIYNTDFFVAHAGDCRAIVGYAEKGRWKGKALTQDHQPSNLRELSRLNQEHPGEEETVAFNAGNGPLRVLGGMMPSRGTWQLM
jgi:pyruvate dehydrogenase phosphatase